MHTSSPILSGTVPVFAGHFILDLERRACLRQAHNPVVSPADQGENRTPFVAGPDRHGKATLIQKWYRGFRTRGRPHAFGYHAIKNAEGEEVLRVRYDHRSGRLAPRRLLPAPSRFSAVPDGASGNIKTLVGQYLPQGEFYRDLPGYVLLSSLGKAAPADVPKRVIEALEAHGLNTILPQHRIAEGEWIARRMEGSVFDCLSMHDPASASHADYPALRTLDGYRTLVSQIKTLHALNLLHRDIKAENLLVGISPTGTAEPFLSDLESLVEIGQPADFFGTPGFHDYSNIYQHYPELKPPKGKPVDMTAVLQRCGKEMDQYALLKTLMEVVPPAVYANRTSMRKRGQWLMLHVKPQYLRHAFMLIADPVGYSRCARKVHLADMLRFAA